MFTVYYKKPTETVKRYKTAGTAGRPVHCYIWPILGMNMSHRISFWMSQSEQNGKQRSLTVGNTIRIEYTPTR